MSFKFVDLVNAADDVEDDDDALSGASDAVSAWRTSRGAPSPRRSSGSDDASEFFVVVDVAVVVVDEVVVVAVDVNAIAGTTIIVSARVVGFVVVVVVVVVVGVLSGSVGCRSSCAPRIDPELGATNSCLTGSTNDDSRARAASGIA